MRHTLLLILLPFLSAAQPVDLNDPDIVWAIAITQDWSIDTPSFDPEGVASVTTLKTLHDRPVSSTYLAELVFQAAAGNQLRIFKDSSCLIPTDVNKAFPGIDTFLIFDPETYSPKLQVVMVEPKPRNDIKGWRLHQILAYNKKNAMFSSDVIAIAPLIMQHSLAGDSIGLRPMFWFKPDAIRPDVLSDDIVWAKKTVNKQEYTRVRIEYYDVKYVKYEKEYFKPVFHLAEVFEKDSSAVFYDGQNEKQVFAPERITMIASSDTLVFNYGTDKEYTKVVHITMNMDVIRELRLIQTWYWDDRRRQLYICLDAVAPLQWSFGEKEGVRYNKALFYRRAKGL